MNKAEEILIEETIKVFEKTACKQTYQMAEGIKEAVKFYHQSRVNSISDYSIVREFNKRFADGSQEIQFADGGIYVKNKLLKQ